MYKIPAIFSVSALKAAHSAAADTTSLQSQGGWTQLAFVQGSAAKPYTIAARSLKDGRTQFACGCPHWRFRCQSSGMLCKHQQAVLCGGLLGDKPADIQWTKAGGVFLTTLATVTMEQRVARHVVAVATAKTKKAA